MNAVKKILIVNATMDPVTGGGTAERSYRLAKYLAEAGRKPNVLTFDIGEADSRLNQLKNVGVTVLPCASRRFLVPFFKFRIIAKLIRSCDVLHLTSHWTILNAICYRYARIYGKPFVICPAGTLPAVGRSLRLKDFYNRCVGNRILLDANRVVAVTAGELPGLLPFVQNPKRLVVIPNGVDDDAFRNEDTVEFRRVHKLGSDPYILFLGRLDPNKGPDLLVEAFAKISEKHSQYKLAIVGPDDGMKQDLQRRVSELSLGPRVRFLGYLGGKDKRAAYQAADFLVVPSRREAMSIVAVESGAAGTPVLMTDICGFDEVQEIDGGMVVPVSVEALADGIHKLLQNRERLKLMGSNLNSYVKANFSWRSVVKKYLTLFDEVCAEDTPCVEFTKVPFERAG